MRRTVVLEQDRIAATVFARDGKAWRGGRAIGPDAVLECHRLRVN